MRVSLLYSFLTVLVAVTAQGTLEFDDYASLLKRQAPGTPQYDCHAACGRVVAARKETGYCTNTSWTDAYAACLKCALQYSIWSIYGPGVTSVSQACSLTPTPSPSGAVAASTTSVSSLTTEPSFISTTVALTSVPTSSPSIRPAAGLNTTTTTSTSAAGSAATTSPTPTAGARRLASGYLLGVGTLAAIFAGLLVV
ncbi:hypothetical protein B0H63DRAFT_221031 [Podospora didyma]|uniref:Uncharacterized protein n=1 Tax=Podospora didyma TaxID=330526 RepID=A0AAE0NBR9_9PEZI|nr:hypothetical protein B0H63DRAFT_221031 [Podospora didyma]